METLKKLEFKTFTSMLGEHTLIPYAIKIAKGRGYGFVAMNQWKLKGVAEEKAGQEVIRIQEVDCGFIASLNIFHNDFFSLIKWEKLDETPKYRQISTYLTKTKSFEKPVLMQEYDNKLSFCGIVNDLLHKHCQHQLDRSDSFRLGADKVEIHAETEIITKIKSVLMNFIELNNVGSYVYVRD